MFEALTSRLTGILLALGLSTTLWVLVVNQQNPEVTATFDAIPVEVQNVPTDVVVASELPTIQLTVSTPQDHQPQLRRDSFKAWVDLRDGIRGAKEYQIQVQTTDRAAKVQTANPNTVTVRLDPITRKDIPVHANLSGRPPDGYVANEQQVRVSPEKVTVSGGQSLVDTIDEAQVTVRLDGAREPVSQSVRPVPIGQNGTEVRGVTVNPTSVLVEVPVERQSLQKVVPVRAQAVGTVRQGYQIVSIDVNPPALAVIGDPTAVEALTALNTAPIDVRNSSTDIIRSVDITLPNGVSLVRREQVTVHVAITAQQGSETVRTAPVAQNVPEGLEAVFSRPSVSVTLAGPEPTLTSLPPEEIKVTVDLANQAAGTYTLTPTVTVPTPLRVVSVDPPE